MFSHPNAAQAWTSLAVPPTSSASTWRVDRRFSDIGIGREMHDRPGPVRLEYPREVFLVAQLAAFQRPPFDRSLMAMFEAVDVTGT